MLERLLAQMEVRMTARMEAKIDCSQENWMPSNTNVG
jgi:hypothetical protein